MNKIISNKFLQWTNVELNSHALLSRNIPKNTTKAGDEKGMVTTYQFLLNMITQHFPGGRDTSTKAERLAAWKAEKALDKAAAASPASSPVSTSPTNNQMESSKEQQLLILLMDAQAKAASNPNDANLQTTLDFYSAQYANLEQEQATVKMDMDSYDGPPPTMQVATELSPHGFMTVPLPPPAHSLPSPVAPPVPPSLPAPNMSDLIEAVKQKAAMEKTLLNTKKELLKTKTHVQLVEIQVRLVDMAHKI